MFHSPPSPKLSPVDSTKLKFEKPSEPSVTPEIENIPPVACRADAYALDEDEEDDYVSDVNNDTRDDDD